MSRRIQRQALRMLSMAVVAGSSVSFLGCSDRGAGAFRAGAPERIEIVGTRATAEIPPWFVEGPPAGYLVTSNVSYSCATTERLGAVDASIALPERQCVRVLAGGTADLPDAGALDGRPEWSRNYHGVFAAQEIGGELVTINHGENKNEVAEGRVYLNTINTDVGAECLSGPNAVTNTYDDCWSAYNAFVTMAHAPVGAATPLIDEGPIAWPSNGLLENGKKASNGLRHPSAIATHGALYVFFLDEEGADAPGRRPGIKVVRSPLSAAGRPGTFEAYSGTAWGTPALPVGFDAARMHSFLEAKGPAAEPLFAEDGWKSIRFSVAHVLGTQEFLGVEERVHDEKGWVLAFRLSTDLVHWSAPVELQESAASNWDEAFFNYPVLMSADGASNTEIALEDFWVVGTHASVPYRIKVSTTPR